MRQELVLLIDFGGQYNQLVARWVRELSVYCEMVPYDISYGEIVARNPQAIILCGELASIDANTVLSCDKRVFSMGIPILGINYGMQLMAAELGGSVVRSESAASYHTKGIKNKDDLLFKGIEDGNNIFWSNEFRVTTVPEGFSITAATDENFILAMSNPSQRLYGVQFNITAGNKGILENFLVAIARLKGDWHLGAYIDEMIMEISDQVGEKKVLCALSGGVDSAVAAALVHKAVGDKLICVFVDTGLMRKNEAEQVIETFKNQMKMNLIFVDAQERFLRALSGVSEPEKKRKIIGEKFIRIFEEEKAKLGEIDYLVQGTIYSDIIESGTKTTQGIKSHHNVGGLPEDMEIGLIEPLRMLFKDEVRILGEKLGLAADIIWRQPFPGPGLGVRVLGEVTAEKVEILRAADAIVCEEIAKDGLDREIWQYFAVLPPVKSVGVTEGIRTYQYPIIVRAVISDDAMTAKWAHIPYELLDTIAKRIVNEVKGINRVAYDITSKPPGTIEWE